MNAFELLEMVSYYCDEDFSLRFATLNDQAFISFKICGDYYELEMTDDGTWTLTINETEIIELGKDVRIFQDENTHVIYIVGTKKAYAICEQ